MLKKLVKKLSKNKKGFTLIELIVVIAILAILAAILVPTVGSFIGSAHNSAAQADARSVYTAAETYSANNNVTYTASTNVYAGAGATATAGQIDDAGLTKYLGGGTWPFTISAITTDANSNVATVKIHENGLYYTFNGSTLTSSAS